MLITRVFGSSSHGNCYLLSDGGSSIMLEAGVDVKRINVDWENVEAVLITHEHGDHMKYLKAVLKRCGANAYCTRGTAQGLDVPKHRLVEIEARKQFTIGEWRIIAFQTEHDANEPVGFLITTPSGKRVLFATDTYYVRYRFNGLTHIMIECNYSLEILQERYQSGRIDKRRRDRLLSSHFELENVKQFFRKNDLSNLEEVYLLHLSDDNSDEVLFRTEIEKVAGVPVVIARR